MTVKRQDPTAVLDGADSPSSRSLTCGAAPGRCRCRFASSPCAASCRSGQPWARGSPALLPWSQVGLCPAGSSLELPAQASQQQPNVIKRRAASAASPVEQRISARCSSLEEPPVPGSALKPQRSLSTALGRHITVGRRVQRWSSCNPQSTAEFPLLWLRDIPLSAIPALARSGWCFQQTLCRCCWCSLCFLCSRQGSCVGKARWFVFWSLVTEKHAMTFSSNFTGGESPNTLCMVSTNTSSLSASLWNCPWVPG